jgi:hypothetical protein
VAIALLAVIAHAASAVDLRPGDILVSDQGPDTEPAVFHVDPATGDRTIASSPSVGSGPVWAQLTSIAVTSQNVFVSETDFSGSVALGTVYRIDPADGSREVLSSPVIGNGPDLAHTPAMIVGNRGLLFLTDQLFSTNRLMSVDRLSGDRSIVSSSGFGTGTNFLGAIEDAAHDRDGDLLVNTRGTVYLVDVDTGDREVISSSDISMKVGGGVDIGSLRGMDIEASRTTLVAVDRSCRSVLRVDIATGYRSLVSTGAASCYVPVGTGPGMQVPVDVSVEPSGTLIVAEQFNSRIIRVDPTTGDRELVSASGLRGSGPGFDHLHQIAVVRPGPVPSLGGPSALSVAFYALVILGILGVSAMTTTYRGSRRR